MWGQNWSGQLGDGAGTFRVSPIKVMNSVKSVSCNGATTAILLTDNSLWMCGSNSNGQFGTGTTIGSTVPIKVMESVVNISNATISGINKEYSYTGKSICPLPNVTFNGTTLKKDKDYSVSYENNKNTGTAYIEIKGIGDYTGTKRAFFEIVEAKQTITGPSSLTTNYSVNGTFKINATAPGKLTYSSNNKNVVTVNSNGKVTIKGTGEAIITIKAAKVANKYKAATKKVTIKIKIKNKYTYINIYKGSPMKDKASSSGKTIQTIPYSTKVTVSSYTNGWGYISYNGKKGYVQCKYLSETKPVPKSNDQIISEYSDQMNYRLVDFTKNFSKNAYKGETTTSSIEKLKQLGNMINVYSGTKLVEEDKNEIVEAFANGVLQALYDTNIDKYETNSQKMMDQITKQITKGIKSGTKKVTVSSGKTYTVKFMIMAQSLGGIGATSSWITVSYNFHTYTVVAVSTSEQINKVLSSYCTVLAQLNTDTWKDFMAAYITDGWKLSGLKSGYKLTDKKVRTYLDHSELLIRTITGDTAAKKKLIGAASDELKKKLNSMSNAALRKYIKEHMKNGDQILNAADAYKKASDKYIDWKTKYDIWVKSKKGTDLEKAESAFDMFVEMFSTFKTAIDEM